MRTHDELIIEALQRDPNELQMFIQIGLEDYKQDGDIKHLMGGFRLAVESQGGVSKVARRMKMTKADLEKRLKSRSELRYTDLADILQALGINLETNYSKAA